MCSVASRVAYICLYLYMYIFVVPSCFRSRRAPRETLWERVHSKACIISLGNECKAVMADMVAFVACCVVSPVLAELRQREELFVIR